MATNSVSEVKSKSKLIYWRLIDVILKLDNIEGEKTGEEYLNMDELGTDSRL